MFILDEPYVSDYLRDAVVRSGSPVLRTEMADARFAGTGAQLYSSAEFSRRAQNLRARIYANSENAIGWIAEHLADTDLPRQIHTLKDKVVFRDMLAPLHPQVSYREVSLADLDSLDVSTLPVPFVIKPAVGFFSIGVYVVGDAADWPGVREAIHADVASRAALYPGEVLGMKRFIIEQVIEGEEFAVDAYFRADGSPVIVDIMGHLFAGDDDVSDRVYYTSPSLMERWLDPLRAYLVQVGEVFGLHDFPVHAELRVDAKGEVVPIEINPMRFGGWCAADMAWWAWGEDPYAHYLEDTAPEWERIIAERSGRACGLVVADIPADVDLQTIRSVDYEAFVSRFSSLLDLRPTDFNAQPVFAFAFVEVPADDMSELESVLQADMREYLEY